MAHFRQKKIGRDWYFSYKWLVTLSRETETCLLASFNEAKWKFDYKIFP